MKLGVVDLGSNNVRLVIWEIYGDGYYRIIDELKENIRLGSDAELKLIPKLKVEIMLDTLSKFNKLCESMEVDKTIVVATESLRRAENSASIISKVKETTGFEILVLSEIEEAYLDYKGVSGSMIIENSLLVDIGGTSCELAWIKDNELVESTSIPVGTLNTTEKFSLSDIVTQKNHIQLEEYIHNAISSIEWIKGNKFKTIILVGGSARTIGRIDRFRKRYPLTITHNYTLEDVDIVSMYSSLMTKNAAGRSKTPGLEEDRADIILAALAVIKEVSQATGTTELRISGKGLREGILFDYINANYKVNPDMLEKSVYSILYRHDLNIGHAEHVTKLSRILFDSLKPVHKLSEDLTPVLYTASMLHDIGMSIRYYDHEKHSFYIILNSEINGLNQKEILLAGYSAMFHRKVDTDLSMASYSHILNRFDVLSSEKMGILIALAESFEKNVQGVVYDIETEITQDNIIIKAVAEEETDIEISEAKKLSGKFKELYNKNLVIKGQIKPRQ